MTFEKKYKIIFLWEISGFSVVKKAPSPWKKCFSKRQSVQLICADKIFKTVCGNFLKINGSRDI